MTEKKGRCTEGMRGYSPDFYLCVEERISKGDDCDSAIAICEVIYG